MSKSTQILSVLAGLICLLVGWNSLNAAASSSALGDSTTVASLKSGRATAVALKSALATAAAQKSAAATATPTASNLSVSAGVAESSVDTTVSPVGKISAIAKIPASSAAGEDGKCSIAVTKETSCEGKDTQNK